MNAHAKIPSASTLLSSRALIVSLSISQWAGRRLDREITDEVNQQHNAAADAGRYNKLLLPKEALAGIQKVVSATRTGFIERTLPWMDSGSRIMAADAYMAHTAWMRGQERKFSEAVDAFLTTYPDHVNDARRRLGGLFKDEDYPTVEQLRGRFRMETHVLPVPTSDDFRVTMSEAQAERIRADIERHVTEATQDAVRNIYERVAELARRMVERLNAYKPAKGKDKAEGIFRDSLVENVRDMIEVLPALNITGDPALDELGERLKSLAQWDASVLREDAAIRRDVAHEAQQILNTIGDFLG